MFLFNYSNADLKAILNSQKKRTGKSGYFNFDPHGFNFKDLQFKRFLVFKGRADDYSFFVAKVEHRTTEAENFIDVEIKLSEGQNIPLIGLSIMLIYVIFCWIFPNTIELSGLIFFTVFTLVVCTFCFLFYRRLYKSFEKNLIRFFSNLNV